jgi:L-rhamnose mutarotase
MSAPASQPAPLIRKAFVMAVNPGKADEYLSRHNPIWPDLASTLKLHGVHNYSIFYHSSTRQLFGYVEVEDDARWAAIAKTEVCHRWWRYMSEIMPSHEDGSPLTARLTEFFHLE